MKKIGIITFFSNYNYGSVLQCYALQQIIRYLGADPIAIKQSESGFQWKVKKTKRLFEFAFSLLKYPYRLKYVYENYKESKRSCNDMSEATTKLFDRFIDKNIRYELCSYKELNHLDPYDGYLSGSDQVWGTSGYFLNPFMFLRFTHKSKRFSYAASFGTDSFPKWYESKLRKFISGYTKLSVREETGKTIIENFGLNVTRHVDPTLLLDKDEWDYIAQAKIQDGIFLYFLNKPSDLAIEHINNLILKNKTCKVYAAPYSFDEYSRINCSVEIIDLSPEEFLGMISKANVICTDSFHGAVFSVIYRKCFYSYYRQYSHKGVQNNRIETLLNHYKLDSQLINNSNLFYVPDYSYADEMIKDDRNKAIDYLRCIIEDDLK